MSTFVSIFTSLVLVLISNPAISLITRPDQLYLDAQNDNYILNNKDAEFPKSRCCVIPTCISPEQCYHTMSCGMLCNTGKYPPAEHTPGYNLRPSYSEYGCRFEKCKDYVFSCEHCQNPREDSFNYHLVREDCKQCYDLQ